MELGQLGNRDLRISPIWRPGTGDWRGGWSGSMKSQDDSDSSPVKQVEGIAGAASFRLSAGEFGEIEDWLRAQVAA